jgi:predicted RNA binding protein YcfA (HicA-like mRNA interferase family)
MGQREVLEVLKSLRCEGWDGEPGKGSHIVMRKPGEPTISVPTSNKELQKGTYKKIAKKAGWE